MNRLSAATVVLILLLLGAGFRPERVAAAPVQAGPVLQFEFDAAQGPHSIYIVRHGDTLLSIARRYGIPVQAILAANPHIVNPNRIFPGQRLVIPSQAPPGPVTYTVQRGDTLLSIARRYGLPVQAILAANPHIGNPNRIFPGQRLVIPGFYAAPTPFQPYGDTYGQPSRQPQPGMQAQVGMRNNSFLPQQITVQPGTTVTWLNQDTVPHTVTAGTQGNSSGLFDSGNMSPGGTFSFTFQNSGTYNYYCAIHPGMTGSVVVQ